MGEYSIQVNQFDFNEQLDLSLEANFFINNFWPLVYIISDGRTNIAYIGETADAYNRMQAHLKNDKKSRLTSVLMITCDRFNKSATLDIESSLIKYMSADKVFKLLNSNIGLSGHNYYQKEEVYRVIFTQVWDQLRRLGITKHSIEHLDNSDLFKYSPYKTLSNEQYEGLKRILENLLNKDSGSIIAQGGAGTGKTILAIFLFKLLSDDLQDFNYDELGKHEPEISSLVKQLKNTYPNLKMALVVPMASFRKTLKKVFKNITGLNTKMVIGPAEVSKSKYDILLVDEAHRLRQRVNLGAYYGSFDKASLALGFDKMKHNELDWILKQSEKSIFFYDSDQSIKPSDIPQAHFERIKKQETTSVLRLKSQFRAKGGNDYVQFLDNLLYERGENTEKYSSNKYDLVLFNSIEDFRFQIQEREKEQGLSRMIAGYSWKWISKKDKSLFDIQIENTNFQWNSVANDWINSSNSFNEVGCIHTTQGYDLNFAAIIFGNEIIYDPIEQKIKIDETQYHDRNGKQTIKNPEELKSYILNIYKTIMLRGIQGTYVYVCNPELREYFAKYIHQYENKKEPLKLDNYEEIVPYENALPVFDLKVSAGDFGYFQDPRDISWMKIKPQNRINENMFICQVIGESMNKIIPNGSYCIFEKYSGGSRNGQIVLVEKTDLHDQDFGSCYTIKEYYSKKEVSIDGWKHESIKLKPRSFDETYQDIVLEEDALMNLKVIGQFLRVVE
ncbi:MAG: DUF2075 domain-containing protein [Flavobacteriales bacterium]|jgi:DUF2075 family protein/predicted GIY-YIG superfamily endonuclease|nr:DUF2075 domain-containing protein [Flavobacteriales bacterium]